MVFAQKNTSNPYNIYDSLRWRPISPLSARHSPLAKGASPPYTYATGEKGHIMLLRSISKHVKDQNWFAVFLDFFIVVAGILIAFQITNWNEGRVENKQSQAFSARLMEDLREEAWLYQYRIEYYDDVSVNAQRAIAALEGRLELPDEDLLISAYRATQYLSTSQRRATFDELTSSGRIGLIRDTNIRETAMLVYNFPVYQAMIDGFSSSPYRQAFRMHIPSVVQNALTENCGDKFAARQDYQAIINSLDYPCKLDLPAKDISDAANILRGDPKFAALLRLQLARLKSTTILLTDFNPRIRDGLKSIQEQAK